MNPFMTGEDSLVYALLDTESANVIDWYGSEDEAMADVRDAVERIGREYVRPWALALHEGDNVTAIAEGEALIDRAFDAVSA